jgi:hypothetical protein
LNVSSLALPDKCSYVQSLLSWCLFILCQNGNGQIYTTSRQSRVWIQELLPCEANHWKIPRAGPTKPYQEAPSSYQERSSPT